MCRYFTLRVCCLLGRLIAVAYAADCNLKQPRQAGNPSGEDIATALIKDNQLASVCSGDFPPSNDRISTYNHWNLIYNVTRDDPSQNLQGCQDGFQDIIGQCISNGNYWGGTWSLNGFTYAIYNKVYPSNGLASSDKGGPSSTSANGLTGEPAPTTTEAGDVATTTTSNTDTTTAVPIPGETIVSQTSSDVPVGVPPPGIVPPGGNPGDDGDEGDDGNDEDSSTQTQPSTTASSSSSSAASSSASSTETTVTAIGDVNYPNWEAINQVPLNPNAPIPDGDDFATTTSSSSSRSLPAPTTTSTTPPTTTSTIALYPTGLDVNCLTSQPAGARMLSCFGMLGRLDPDQKICTSDPGACLSSGDSYCAASGGSCDPSGIETINTSNYCMLAQSSGCAFVIANKQSSFGGFPGSSCVTGAQMDQFIRGAANRCAGDGTVALQVGPD
ncbi:MAG: hypothetical protein L6R38_009421, partial [Xanthoria sp. 2 TBL-2021]